MDEDRSLFSRMARVFKLLLAFIGLVLLTSWACTTVTLHSLRNKGVYPSAEAAMLAMIDRGYTHPDQIEIIYAGTNSFDGSEPNVWYVIACVWGGTRVDGSPVGSGRHIYDQPGTFFLALRDGWIHAPEGVFPQLLGFLMRIYGLAGPGSSTPSHDWGSASQHCEF